MQELMPNIIPNRTTITLRFQFTNDALNYFLKVNPFSSGLNATKLGG